MLCHFQISDDSQSPIVDVDCSGGEAEGGTDQCNAGAFAILNVNAGIIDNDAGTSGAFQHQPPGRRLQIIDDENILPQALNENVGRRSRNGSKRERRHVRIAAPAAAYPNRAVLIAMLKFNPNACADRRH